MAQWRRFAVENFACVRDLAAEDFENALPANC
jgi:hypothetical protein